MNENTFYSGFVKLAVQETCGLPSFAKVWVIKIQGFDWSQV